MTVTPLGDRLWLRVPEAPEKIGSIWLPPQAERDYTVCQAEILERGEAVRDWRLQPGARVVVRLFGKALLGDFGFCVWERDVLALLDLGSTESTSASPKRSRAKKTRALQRAKRVEKRA